MFQLTKPIKNAIIIVKNAGGETMYITKENNSLIIQNGPEKIRIDAIGTDSIRVRATKNNDFEKNDQAIIFTEPKDPDIKENQDGTVEVRNGILRCTISGGGYISFYKRDERVFREFSREWNHPDPEPYCLHFPSRFYRKLSDKDYEIKARFASDPKEKIFGMGQFQQPNLNLKGCILDLEPRNTSYSVPFYVSSLGYGFLWNNPALGTAVLGNNYHEFTAECTCGIDYMVTAGDTPKDILKNYTEITGRAPQFPENLLGLWQCKLRYRTQEEVLEVAREYKRRNIPLDMIIIDFFHWPYQGSWSFDKDYFPDPAAMVRELKDMGIRCMVSIWPTVDRNQPGNAEMFEKNYVAKTAVGTGTIFEFFGQCTYLDTTNPEARKYMWEKVKKNYYEYGIQNFWLDVAEPEVAGSEFDNYYYYEGSARKCGNVFAMRYSQLFDDGLRSENKKDIVNLARCAWAGGQRYGTVIWSGDINSNFGSFRDQLAAGLNMGMAGIPWWTTDTGGFRGGDINDPKFHELLVRWFQFSTFSPVLRLHGDREPHNIPLLNDSGKGGAICGTGSPNEMWTYGEDVYRILRKYLDIRLELKGYIKSLFDEASENGSPLLRTMFYEFPEDPKCWELEEQYMFGAKYLVAPVFAYGKTDVDVYLPEGKWKNFHTGEILEGGRTVKADAPVDIIPVFERL